MSFKKISLLFVIIFISITIFSAAEPKSVDITILFTTETSGHPLNFSYNEDNGQGGIPARYTLIKQLAGDRKKNNVLLLDTGNFRNGLPESNLFGGLTDITGMNLCGYDAAGLGLSEIYNSYTEFESFNTKATFSLLSANIKRMNKTKEENFADLTFIKTFGGTNGVKIGVFSVASDEIVPLLSENSKKDFSISDPVNAAQEAIKELKKQKVDIIIGLTYIGYSIDESKITVRTLANNFPEIDMIIDGRSSQKFTEPVIVGNTKIYQGYKWGLYLGEIKLKVENKKIIDSTYTLHPVNYMENGNLIGDKIAEDQTVLKKIKAVMKNYDKTLDKNIVTIKEGNLTVKNIRTQETELGNLITDALLDYTGCEIAIQNAGGISADASVDITKINRKSFDKVIKYNNSLVIVTLTGTELKKVLEYSMKRQGYGGFLQVSGIKFTYSKSSGTFTNIKIRNSDFNEGGFYKVAINNYLAEGGEGYTLFTKIDNKNDAGIMIREIVYSYLQNSKTYTPYLDGRINIIE